MKKNCNLLGLVFCLVMIGCVSVSKDTSEVINKSSINIKYLGETEQLLSGSRWSICFLSRETDTYETFSSIIFESNGNISWFNSSGEIDDDFSKDCSWERIDKSVKFKIDNMCIYDLTLNENNNKMVINDLLPLINNRRTQAFVDIMRNGYFELF